MPSAKVFDRVPASSVASAVAMSTPIPVVANPLKLSQPKKNEEKSEEEVQRRLKRAQELLKLKDSLEDSLVDVLDKLKEVCLKQAEITGELPPEIYMTLHPDEPIPKIKRKVGTTFAIPNDILDNVVTDDRVAMIETDIKMQKEIIAATERMSKDKCINKSLRKKHRKDLQSAHHKLRHLQKGLKQMRLSMSKPDVSSINDSEGSNTISRNSKWSWSKGSHDFTMAKSCPTTPRGSIPDLCDSYERLSNCSRTWNKSPAPSSASLNRLRPATMSTASATSITASTSPNDSGIHSETTPPSIPNRRMTAPSGGPVSPKSRNQAKSMDAEDVPIYENVGYTSIAPYKSAYRQSNFPTLQHREDMSEPNLRRLLTGHPSNLRTSNSTQFSATTSSSSQPSTQESITSAANTQLGRIVQKMSNGVTSVSFLSQPSGSPHRLSMANPATVRAASVHTFPGFSTTSLDRRALRQRQPPPIGAASKDPQTLTTTFPVGLESSTPPIEAKNRSISHHNGIGIGVPHVTVNPRHHSTTRMPPGDWPYPSRDPQMEALLNFYRDGVFSQQLAPTQTVSSPPTTRIVPIQQKPPNNNNNRNNGSSTKEATMV